eukprot:scaffold36156_cov66-Phaeocystis_antarctica.AAC.1
MQVGRVLIHRMSDTVRAQRLGTWTWTLAMVVNTITDAFASVLTPEAVCVPTMDRFLPPLMLILT